MYELQNNTTAVSELPSSNPSKPKLYWKRNSSLIFKTFLYQIVMSLFGMMMFGAVQKVPLINIIGSAIIIFFFHYIMVSQMYRAGSKNCESDCAHKLSSFAWAGFLFALIAFIPTILMSTYSLFFPPFSELGEKTNGYPYLNYLLNKTFFQGMYASVFQWFAPTSGTYDAVGNANSILIQVKIFAFTAIPGILSSGFGYLAGYLNFKKEK